MYKQANKKTSSDWGESYQTPPPAEALLANVGCWRKKSLFFTWVLFRMTPYLHGKTLKSCVYYQHYICDVGREKWWCGIRGKFDGME